MPFLTAEQKSALGPFLGVAVFLLAVCGGVAINTVFGGPRVPIISEFSAIVLGLIGGVIIFRNLTK
jgi:hypothetical protein